jgi:hypothetical protein
MVTPETGFGNPHYTVFAEGGLTRITQNREYPAVMQQHHTSD